MDYAKKHPKECRGFLDKRFVKLGFAPRKPINCLVGQLVWPPSEGGAWLDAGATLGTGGGIAVGMGGAAATATGVVAIVLGAAAVGWGSYRIYQTCHH
jgi:hypothetical protein